MNKNKKFKVFINKKDKLCRKYVLSYEGICRACNPKSCMNEYDIFIICTYCYKIVYYESTNIVYERKKCCNKD
jgi:hypothetical protein